MKNKFYWYWTKFKNDVNVEKYMILSPGHYNKWDIKKFQKLFLNIFKKAINEKNLLVKILFAFSIILFLYSLDKFIGVGAKGIITKNSII